MTAPSHVTAFCRGTLAGTPRFWGGQPPGRIPIQQVSSLCPTHRERHSLHANRRSPSQTGVPHELPSLRRNAGVPHLHTLAHQVCQVPLVRHVHQLLEGSLSNPHRHLLRRYPDTCHGPGKGHITGDENALRTLPGEPVKGPLPPGGRHSPTSPPQNVTGLCAKRAQYRPALRRTNRSNSNIAHTANSPSL